MIRLLVFALTFSAASSQAALRFSLVGAGDLTMFSSKDVLPSDLKFQNKVGYGGGLLVAVPLGNRFEAETGGLYLIRNWGYSGTFSGDFQEESLSGATLEFPVLLRIWLGKAGIVLGGVASSGFGKIKSQVSANGATVSEGEVSYGDLSLDNINLGVTGGLFYRAPIGMSGTSGWLFDLRYQHGLRNRFVYPAGTSNGEFKTSEIRLLVGFTFGGARR